MVEETRTTVGGIPIKPVYTPDDVNDVDYKKEIGDPGVFPFTRGIYSGAKGVVFGQRPVLGFGLPEETNERIKYLLQYGMASPSGMPSYNLTMDMCSAYGYDSDDPRMAQFVGVNGPPCNSIRDSEAILEGIPIEGVYHGALSYAPNWRVAHYVAIADNRNIPRSNILGATLNDSLHGFIGEGLHLFPPKACLRLVVDTLRFVIENMPYFRACDVQAYSSREAGCTAAQEAAFAVADMIDVMQGCVDSGLSPDDVSPHMTFFFACYSDFFEEVAKFRAVRKVWAQVMRERFNVKNDKNLRMRIQVKTSANTLPAQYPQLNIFRAGLQAISAVFGGASGLNITCMDEAFSAPTEESARIALLTGKVIEHETGIAGVADPLAGSYYVERLTRDMEDAVWDYLKKIDEMGGYIAALERGYLQREIARVNVQESHDLDSGSKVVVGVNKFEPEDDDTDPIDIFDQDPMPTVKEMSRRLEKLRKERDNERVHEILSEFREAVKGDGYLMPIMVDAAKALCTTSEIFGTLKEELGEDHSCLVPPDWAKGA
ncbi:MAG: methylmalonyl-CoA mutase family protein [Chloroflexota bacterium]|nr:methylmalonyl-CoA mutase family protein [Chloroflexota bacterium]